MITAGITAGKTKLHALSFLAHVSVWRICYYIALLQQLGLYLLQIRALDKKANKIEKLKNKKGGHNMWNEVHELGQLIRYKSLQKGSMCI